MRSPAARAPARKKPAEPVSAIARSSPEVVKTLDEALCKASENLSALDGLHQVSSRVVTSAGGDFALDSNVFFFSPQDFGERHSVSGEEREGSNRQGARRLRGKGHRHTAEKVRRRHRSSGKTSLGESDPSKHG